MTPFGCLLATLITGGLRDGAAHAQRSGPNAESAGTVLPATSGSIGPDVIIGGVEGAAAYGRIGGVSAFAFGYNVCNVGDEPVSYEAITNQHPIITHNMYRLSNGRIEQIGMSWVIHEFLALAGGYCSADCQDPGAMGLLLGVRCSNPNSASIAGTQSILRARSPVDALAGEFPPPSGASPCALCGPVERRLQVRDADLDPALNAGAFYFVEAQIVASDDAAAGNQNNNTSYRSMSLIEPRCIFDSQTTCRSDSDCSGPGRCWGDFATCMSDADCSGTGRCASSFDPCDVEADCPDEGESCIRCRPDACRWPSRCPSLLPLDGYCPGLTGSTEREQAAIQAWRAHDAAVLETEINKPGTGFLILAAKSTELGSGWWRYEYALQNVNCDRSVGAFSIPLRPDRSVANIGFYDVDYHSGEPFDGTDWPGTMLNDAIVWATGSFDDNPNGNALRWGTLYNFRFDVQSCPGTTTASLELFKPGEPFGLTAATIGPEVRNVGDFSGDCAVGLNDAEGLASCLLGPAVDAAENCMEGDVNDDGRVDLKDAAAWLSSFGG